MIFAASASGFLPLIIHMRFAEWPSVASGSTGDLPSSVIWHAPMSDGICASNRLDFRISAAGEQSSQSGSRCDSSDTPVRRIDIGCALGLSFEMRTIASRTLVGMARIDATSAVNAASSLALGLCPMSKRCATSSKVAFAARSAIS